MNVMQYPGPDLPWHSARAPRSDGEAFFFWSSPILYLEEDVAKLPRVPGGPRNVNPARAIT